jgi:ABC-type amino acid transport system permease subunit
MQTFRVYEPLLAASIIYVALTLLFTRLLARIERPAAGPGESSAPSP